jgi:hypothetical protein
MNRKDAKDAKKGKKKLIQEAEGFFLGVLCVFAV